MQRTNLRPYRNVILTAGAICKTTDGTWRQICGIFATEADVMAEDSDELALGTVAFDDLTAEQQTMVKANSAAMVAQF